MYQDIMIVLQLTIFVIGFNSHFNAENTSTEWPACISEKQNTHVITVEYSFCVKTSAHVEQK